MVNYLSHSPDPRGEKNKRKMSAHVDLEDPALQGKDDSSLGGEGQPLVFVNFYMSSNTQLPSLARGSSKTHISPWVSFWGAYYNGIVFQ